MVILALLFSIILSTAPWSPDPKLTPGANDPSVVDTTLTFDDLCPTSKTSIRRLVPASLARQVYAEYNVDPKSGKFEVDHLCSLELGCNNSILNLWIQSYTSKPYNARMKDALEDRLHAMACRKEITFEEARLEISTDWIKAFNKYFPNGLKVHKKP